MEKEGRLFSPVWVSCFPSIQGLFLSNCPNTPQFQLQNTAGARHYTHFAISAQLDCCHGKPHLRRAESSRSLHPTLSPAKIKCLPIDTDHSYLESHRHTQPPILPPPQHMHFSTAWFHPENVQALVRNSSVELQVVGVEHSSLRLPAC